MLHRNFAIDLVGEPAAVGERFAITMMPAGLQMRLRRRDPRPAVTAGR